MEPSKAEVTGGKPDNSANSGKVNLDGVKRGRGRPPGSKNKASAPERKTNESAPSTDPNGDAVFFAENIVMLYELGDEFIQAAMFRRMAAAIPERAEEFKKLQSEIALNIRDKKMIHASAYKLALKYSILQKFGPEVMMFIVTVQYGARQLRMMKFVESSIANIEKVRKATPVQTPEKN